MKFQDIADKYLNDLKKVTFHIYRVSIGINYTGGELYVEDSRICYTLEDKLRGKGIKVKGETCIPQCKAILDLRYSNRFKRELPCIYTEDDKLTLKANGISFKYLLLHGGNTVADTEGCPLVAYRKLKPDVIQGTASKDVTELVKYFKDLGYSMEIHFHNNSFNLCHHNMY